MKTIQTRELLTKHKSVQASLAAGESFVWTSHGKVVGHLTPPTAPQVIKMDKPNWVDRARRIGAVNPGPKTVSSWVNEDRGK